MATQKPANQTNVNSDQVGDDPKLWRTETAGNVDIFNLLKAALGGASLLDLHGTPGLEAVGQAAGTPDQLRLKLQAAAGLLLEAAGLRLDIDALTAITALATGDKLILYDADASGHKIRAMTGQAFLDAIAGANLTRNGAKLDASGGVLTQSFTSSDQTITFGTAHSVAHGLGATPKIAHVWFINQTPEFGYTAGEQVEITNTSSGLNEAGYVVERNATNVIVHVDDLGPIIVKADDHSWDYITAANWKMRIEAYL